ncbi:unnamed protein product [Acanthoscelides obtectus]|uniref:Uncharacterized protein n=1 Tax=Acanthoscelides obtectus TaxID=200917 RepID=A0A9P0M697_ACAOB|nr:unnamed protein product [Acanthoscelides obtectus]CAK1662596.1 hypothetical protein AOBTE_LOCUS23233 [Acanthoscelides obtectus]
MSCDCQPVTSGITLQQLLRLANHQVSSDLNSDKPKCMAFWKRSTILEFSNSRIDFHQTWLRTILTNTLSLEKDACKSDHPMGS